MSDLQPLFKSTKHGKVFEMKLVTPGPTSAGTQPNPAWSPREIQYFLDGNRLSREDYLAALQMVDAM